jgi:enoyl-CoA hydratase/carnithine racemase
MTDKSGFVRCDKDGSVWIMSIENPSKRNAFAGTMAADLVITGVGDQAFSSGHDLGEMLENPDDAFKRESNAAFMRPQSLRMPVIAAVNGSAYGAGFILALSCDLRIASENAKFSAPGAKVGLLPVGGQISRLFHALPKSKALELMYTGDALSAQEARGLGFVSKVTPVGMSLNAARELADRIARNSPMVVEQIKKGVEFSQQHGAAAGDFFEWTTLVALRDAPDVREGMAAFVDKREPKFIDRK